MDTFGMVHVWNGSFSFDSLLLRWPKELRLGLNAKYFWSFYKNTVKAMAPFDLRRWFL